MLGHVGRRNSMNKSPGAWTDLGANGVGTRGLTTSKVPRLGIQGVCGWSTYVGPIK